MRQPAAAPAPARGGHDECEGSRTRSYDSNASHSTYNNSDTYSHRADSAVAHHIQTKLDDLHAGVFYDGSTTYSPAGDDSRRSSRISVASVASTVPSVWEDDQNPVQPEDGDFDLPDFHPSEYYTDSIPTTPTDFGRLFPSNRKLTICHDESAVDGNMNLKISTNVRLSKGRTQTMTLFHLRMYDLKKREFSIRRHDRNSGREVAHTIRKYQKTVEGRRPGLHRSFSSAMAGLRNRTDSKTDPIPRTDSRDGRRGSLGVDADSAFDQSTRPDQKPHPKIPTNTTKIDFANYSQVEVKRRGTSTKKRYEFEHWGSTYMWRRLVSNQDGRHAQASFQLLKAGESIPLANIVPEPLSPAQHAEEVNKGGWVPPCAMWISDDRMLSTDNDMSDVVVSTGLVALVDDCIKRRFHNKALPVRGALVTRLAKRLTLPYRGPAALRHSITS